MSRKILKRRHHVGQPLAISPNEVMSNFHRIMRSRIQKKEKPERDLSWLFLTLIVCLLYWIYLLTFFRIDEGLHDLQTFFRWASFFLLVFLCLYMKFLENQYQKWNYMLVLDFFLLWSFKKNIEYMDLWDGKLKSIYEND